MATSKFALVELALNHCCDEQDGERCKVVDVPFFEESFSNLFLAFCFCYFWVDIGNEQTVVITNTDGSDGQFLFAIIGRRTGLRD